MVSNKHFLEKTDTIFTIISSNWTVAFSTNLENISSTLTGRADNLGRVNFNKALLGQNLSEEAAHSSLQSV